MECFQCGTPYNDSENCPRLLINCGHSLCQKCLTDNLRQGVIICPECRTLTKSQSLSDFPKNLALLHIKPAPLADRKFNRLVQNEFETEPQKEISAVCQKHRKKVEAFCENDRQLLCITCILEEGYKNQDICSIQDAATKERNLIQKAFELSQIIEGKLKELQKEIIQTNGYLNETAEKARVEITHFFNDIRRTIAERETNLKQKISEQLRKQEHVLRKKEENLTKHLKSIMQFYDEYQQSLGEREISLLNSSSKRIEIIKKATMDIEKLSFVNPFAELNKENELNVLWKMIQPSKAAKDVLHNTTPQGVSKKTNMVKAKGNKEITNKQAGPAGVRSSMNIKKEGLIGATPGNHPFVFSIVDKNGNKIPAQTNQTRETKQKEDYGIENKRMLDKKQVSPGRGASAKNKHSQGYYALRNSQKEREALQEKIPIAEQVGYSDLTEKPIEIKNSKSTLVSTSPKHDGKSQEEHSSGCDTGRSLTPPKKMSFEPVQTIFDNKTTNPTHLQFNQQWDLDLNLGGNEEIKSKLQPGDLTKGESNQVIFNFLNSDGNAQISKIYDMNLSMDQNNTGSIVELSIQRDFKMLSSEIGTSTLDMVDLANQKLDFSLLCQHSTSCVYVMGGFIEDSQHFIEKFDLQKGKWEIAGTFVNNRTKFSSIALPEKDIILIMGGKQEGSRTATCEEYSLTDQVVKPSDITLISPKSGFGAVLSKDEILICGGNDGYSILKAFESYNLKTRKWTTLPPLGIKRDELAVTIGLDQKIYAIGGFGGLNNTCLNEVERYDPYKGCWESIAPLNTPRRALAAVTLPDGIYAIGGFDGENYLSTVEKYEEATNEWVFVASMNYPRCTLSAVISSDFRNIFVLGGFDNGPLKTVERYSVIDDTWEIMPPMYFKRFMHSAVMVSKLPGNRS